MVGQLYSNRVNLPEWTALIYDASLTIDGDALVLLGRLSIDLNLIIDLV